MLKINQIKFTDTMILNGGKFILVELLPLYQEDEAQGMAKKRIGTLVVVALTARKLEKIEVFLEAVIACSPFNQLSLAEIVFSDFEGRFTVPEGSSSYVFSAKASQLQLAKE